LGFFEFFPHRGWVDLSKQGLERGLAIQEDFEVVRVLEILHQRGVRQHGAQGSPQGLVASFASAMAFEVAKEPLQQIVGSLGLDRARTLRRGNDQRSGEQLGAIVIDLLDHLLQRGRGRIIRARPNVRAKSLNVLLERFHLDRLALMIEALVSADRSHPQRLAELIEQLAIGFQPLQRMAQRAILSQVPEVPRQVVKGQVVPPRRARVQREERLQLGMGLLRPAREPQQRTIKREAIALALLQCGQDPVG